MSGGRSNLVDVEDCTVLAFTDQAVKVDHGSGQDTAKIVQAALKRN